MKTFLITFYCLAFTLSVSAQGNKLADSLRYVTDIPYIGSCGDSVLWKIIGEGKEIVPDLIDKLTDTRKLKGVAVMFFGGEYTVADAAYIALQEIIEGIPTFELLNAEFSGECGYCAYWYHLRSNRQNRQKFQKAVREWYHQNEDNLVWVKTYATVTSDCFPSPIGGHYKLKSLTNQEPANEGHKKKNDENRSK